MKYRIIEYYDDEYDVTNIRLSAWYQNAKWLDLRKNSNMKSKLILIGAFLVGTLLFTSAKSNTSSAVIVTNRDCISYLTNNGYTNVVVLQVYQDGSRLCDTSNPYHTTVLVGGDQIIGHVDDGMN